MFSLILEGVWVPIFSTKILKSILPRSSRSAISFLKSSSFSRYSSGIRVLIRERLEKAVAEIQNVDANRFEQELIFYLEKLDITEEKIRLKKHLDYFLETLHSEDSNGRKLGFISQEIGREINTLGSKANFAPMQQLVVQMKDELEKIKEQVLNVL